ncbi:MAG: MvaI/BcnI family restriction endonuclease [Prevotellaceae bacterium]|nr:MvaI/BcnI family restriction endonuclease [Prevotellaceae bacterium]
MKGASFFKADDIFAIIAYRHLLYVVNITSVDIPKACRSVISTPLKDLIVQIEREKNSVSNELLSLIRDRMTSWIPVEVMADTGIGRTVETMLGIPMNASKEPDYKGIELKSLRQASTVRAALFTQTPDWLISRLKSGREIVEAYGYIHEGLSAKTLQVTVRANKPNMQRLGLFVNREEEILEIDEFGLLPKPDGTYRRIQDVASWQLPKLHDRLLTKHRETFWIDVETRDIDGREYFRCRAIEHTKNPLVHQFDNLLQQGDIQVDLLLCRPSGHGDTYSFKIKKKSRPLLFPESERHILIDG